MNTINVENLHLYWINSSVNHTNIPPCSFKSQGQAAPPPPASPAIARLEPPSCRRFLGNVLFQTKVFKESGLVVPMFIYLSPLHVIFFEASHWSSDHMISLRHLIGQPSFPTYLAIVSKIWEEIGFKDFGGKSFQRFWRKFV